MMGDRRVAVVTGATSGIGRAVALALARRGDRVLGVGRDPGRIASLAADLAGEGHRVLALDVAREGDMDALRRVLEDEVGRADLLVASAALGRAGPSALPPRTRDLPLADWQAMMDVNLHGVFLADRAVLGLMRAAGEGDIVNVASSTTPHGLRGTPLAPAYCAAKFAIAAMGRALAEELAPDGIRVRTLFPGTVDTPLIAGTALGGAFGGAMSPASVADTLLRLLDLGREMDLREPFLLPTPLATPLAGRGPSLRSA